MSDDGELDLNSLNDEELVQQVHDDLYDGLKEEVEAAVHILLKRGWTPYKVLTEALVEGMRIVGVDFRDGILFVPEVLLAANSMKAGMFILRPLLAALLLAAVPPRPEPDTLPEAATELLTPLAIASAAICCASMLSALLRVACRRGLAKKRVACSTGSSGCGAPETVSA